ncbi:MAG: hypothetical protein ACD_28C00235G0003 [uncultured bacterium]|nr:MAG: hypothetical protein ACD_28C00235G0003 [uncultured bacterium]KKT73598.1 MAG: hypothetical protein UW70_C0080G0006 [Candidatus Peregrinibacteria bacterium GW2011_GWA2_44_7]
MASVVPIAQIFSAILLSLLILVQNRGSGLSATFGGTGGFYASKRGAERVLAIATIFLLVAFLGLSFAASIVK